MTASFRLVSNGNPSSFKDTAVCTLHTLKEPHLGTLYPSQPLIPGSRETIPSACPWADSTRGG